MNKICHLKLSTYLMRDIRCRDYRFVSKKAEHYDDCLIKGSNGDVTGRYDGHSFKKYFNLLRFKTYKFMLQTGSIMPDILVYTYIRGHEYGTSFDKINKKLVKLETKGKWSIRSCYRLGYLLHYLEDYFTYPHNSNFTMGLVKHRQYEVGLQPKFLTYLKEKWKTEEKTAELATCMGYAYDEKADAGFYQSMTNPAVTAGEKFVVSGRIGRMDDESSRIMDIFDKIHNDYMLIRPAHERDCQYIVECAEKIAEAFFALFEEKAAAKYMTKLVRKQAVVY